MKIETIHWYSLSNRQEKGKAASRAGVSAPKKSWYHSKRIQLSKLEQTESKTDSRLKLRDILLQAVLNKAITHY